MTHCDISKVKRAIRYITHCQEYKERDVFKLHFQYPCQVNIEGGAGMRGDAQGWSREISYTGLIRKEVCSDCIKSTSPNITQTLSTPAKLFQSGLSCLKLSVTSSVKVGLAIFRRVCDSVEGKGGRKKKKSCPLSFTGSEYSAITVKSTNLCHPLPTPQRWQAEAHLKAQKAQNAKESHQKFAEELLERTKTQTSAGAPSI